MENVGTIRRGAPFALSTAVALADQDAGALLSTALQDHARRYVAARRQFGDALLEAVAELAAARAEARHGEWGIFLEAIGLDDATARAQIRIHEACQANPRYAELVRSGWLSEATARELLAAPAEVQTEILSRKEPPTQREIKQAKREALPVSPAAKPKIPEVAPPPLAAILTRLDAHGYARVGSPRVKGMTTYHTFRDYASDQDDETAGVIELAEGELPYWLAELDETARIKAERRLLRHPCATCGQPSTSRRTIGGISEPRCDACTAAAELSVTMEAEASADLDGRTRTAFGDAICDRAERLGAQIDYRPGETGPMRVLPPPGYQMVWLRCDARELAKLCDAWEKPVAERAPLADPVDAIRVRAAHLLKELAPLMTQMHSEHLEDLSMAISDLNECQEGTEGQHWVRVGWALLDLEGAESEATP